MTERFRIQSPVDTAAALQSARQHCACCWIETLRDMTEHGDGGVAGEPLLDRLRPSAGTEARR